MSSRKVIDLFGDHHQSKAEAPPANEHVNEAPPEYLQSSKEKFARLNPYFERILTQLASSHKYDLPDDLFNKLAEVFSIKNRDAFSIELLLTVGKLQPLISKKLNLKWSTIEKDIIRPLIKKHRAEYYSSNLYTFDNIPNHQWFPPFDEKDKPEPWYMNIALAFIRYPCDLLRYDEFDDMYHVKQKNGIIRCHQFGQYCCATLGDFSMIRFTASQLTNVTSEELWV